MFLELWNLRGSLNKDVHNVRSYLFTWLRRKEQLVYLSLRNYTLIARRPPAVTVEISNELGISFSKDRIILYRKKMVK
jgi:hypothetical protein